MVTDKIRETKITEGNRVGAILARAMTMGRVGFSGGVDEVGVDMEGDAVMRGTTMTIIGGGRRVDIKTAGGCSCGGGASAHGALIATGRFAEDAFSGAPG